MTQEDNGKLPEIIKAPRIKSGDCMPNIGMSIEVADDLRAYIFGLIDTKEWASRSDREIAGEIINADEKGTDKARFYVPEADGSRKRLNLETLRMLLRTYRHRSLEVFKDDLIPYLQEAIVEIIKTAGKNPRNLKIILDGLQLGTKEVQDGNNGKDTPSTAYTEVRKRIGMDGDAPKRTGAITKGLGTLGYEDSVRDNTGKRRRPAAGVVSRRDDPGMDEPPNIIEVDGGPYATPSLPLKNDLFNDRGEYMGDTEEPEYSDTDELSGVAPDEESDGHD